MDSPYSKIWKVVLDYLSKIYSEVLMDLWLNRLELVSLDDKNAFLVIDENQDLIDILNTNYSKQIADAFSNALSMNLNVKIFNRGHYLVGGSEEEKMFLEKEKEAQRAEAAGEKKPEKPVEFYFDKGEGRAHEDEFTFDNFIVGSSNKFAYAASVSVARDPAVEYNPLFIYGASGLGKTHLMRAIAHDVSSRHPDYRIIFVSAENFTNEFLDCLVKKSTSKFKEKYRSADMLFVDDIQFIAGKESTQEEFFHTFNTLYDSHKQIVLTSDRPPRELQNLEERLVSRFEGGMVADVQPPDTELRIAIFKSKAMAMNVDRRSDIHRREHKEQRPPDRRNYKEARRIQNRPQQGQGHNRRGRENTAFKRHMRRRASGSDCGKSHNHGCRALRRSAGGYKGHEKIKGDRHGETDCDLRRKPRHKPDP